MAKPLSTLGIGNILKQFVGWHYYANTKCCRISKSDLQLALLRPSANPLSQGEGSATIYPPLEGGSKSVISGRGRKAAFTLAEVLITLGIIGVVAAITLPTIVANYKERVLVNQVKKTYSEFQNVLRLYMAKNECSDIMCFYDANQTVEEHADRFFKMFEGAHLCSGQASYDTKKLCRSVGIKDNKTPYYLNGVTTPGDSFRPRVIAANGAAYAISKEAQCPGKYMQEIYDDDGFVIGQEERPFSSCLHFYFDANGVHKGPNQYGADIYRFDLKYTGELIEYHNYSRSALINNKLDYKPYEFGVSKK